MNIQLLKKLYNIYSPSGNEHRMIKFLYNYINNLSGDISLSKDNYGNIYVTKGTSDTYPCLVSHIDQVSHCHHSKDFKTIETKDIIFGYSPSKKRFENIGADDKNGIFICLECLKKFDILKVVFFREEEIGCKGSTSAYMPFFNNVRFVIQPDRKGNSDLISAIGSIGLCTGEFIETVEAWKWGYYETNGMMTDVFTLKKNGLDVCCINVSCGYYNAHTDEEITVKEDLQKCLRFIEHIIKDCTSVFPHRHTTHQDYSFYEYEDIIYEILEQDPSLTPEELYDMLYIHFPHLTLNDYAKICMDYMMIWENEEEMYINPNFPVHNENDTLDTAENAF